MKKNQQKKTPLWTRLEEYCNSNVSYFDVPGHKKNIQTNAMSKVLRDLYRYDINSSPEVDNLAHPKGVINESLKLLADAFGADDAYFLTNGTTQGIHTLITASVYPGEKIIIPRNSHKSVINGIILAGAKPIFIQPIFDKKFGISHNITLSELKKVFKKHPDSKALLLLNPTYFGVVTNLNQISTFCKQNKIILLTDEAHGAHFYFHSKFPKGGLKAGAQGAAISFHKTLGSLTQSSVLIWKENQDYGLQSKYIWQWNAILTTTSPSFLLMASIDAARSRMAVEGKKLFDQTLELSRYAREELDKISGIEVLSKDHIGYSGAYNLDETKLVIKVDKLGYSGFEFYEELRTNYNIQLELSETKVVMALITFMDTKETVNVLIRAIKDIAENKRKDEKFDFELKAYTSMPKRVLAPRETLSKSIEEVYISKSAGRISADSLMYYPPGIPLVLPGEVISQEMVDFYEQLLENDVNIITSASSYDKILVVKDIIVDLEE